jgi:prepilin-type processing-associated H-X9-DG protein
MVALTETVDLSRSLEENPFLGRISGAFANISLLMYASSTQLCLSLLHCVSVGDNQVLFLDGHVKCYKTFQYFLFVYMISSIPPFCLVPILGSYLLKLSRISVAQLCLACIFPLPFCCYWSYLLVRNSSWWMRHTRRVETNDQIQDDVIDENFTDSTTIEGRGTVSGNINAEIENLSTETELSSKPAVLRVLRVLRPRQGKFYFPCLASSMRRFSYSS